jgi:hypothetical protein
VAGDRGGVVNNRRVPVNGSTQQANEAAGERWIRITLKSYDVLISVGNEEKIIRRIIQSMINQTYLPSNG